MTASGRGGAAPDIFISYKREDQARASELAAALGTVGWRVWWDPELRAGEHFDRVIEEALAACRCVIVLWSTRSVDSQYVRDEASFALGHEKLVPIRLDDAELPFRFQGLHTLDFTDWSGADTAAVFRELTADIATQIGSPGEPKPRANSSLPAVAAHPLRRIWMVFAAIGVVAVTAIVTGVALRTENGEPTECLLALEIEPVGHTSQVRAVELSAGGTRRPFPVSGGKTIIQVPGAHLRAWQVDVVWNAGDPSPVTGLGGCRDWNEHLSDDGRARLSISRR